MSAQGALNAVLVNTGLEAVPDGVGGLIVRRQQASVPELAPPAAVPINQEKPFERAPIESVIVSASRINDSEYSQPVPITVLGSDQLKKNAYSDIGDEIRQLPMMGTSVSPQNGMNSGQISGANAGTDTVDLRNLGVSRTLVLIDSQRTVQSNITGEDDLGTIPTSLVARIDIVTGGASAAWGSDAVAGVVNLVLDKSLTGLRVNLEGGDTFKNDRPTAKLDIAWGAPFDGNRGHLILSGSVLYSPNAIFQGQRNWYTDTYLLNNPAYGQIGQPRLIHVSNVGLAQATPGGVITASAAGTSAPADALAGIQFVGPTAIAEPFHYAIASGVLASGGDVGFYTGESPINLLALPYHSETLFAFASYSVSSSVQASLQLNVGHSWAENDAQAAVQFGSLVIQGDNAFIPSSVRTQMVAGGIPSFTIGTTNTNNADLQNISLDAASTSLGIPVNDSNRQLLRGVFTLNGTLGSNWSWSSYYEEGNTRVSLRVKDDLLIKNFQNAVDAVTVTAANQGSSGIPVGSTVCRSTLTNPGDNCMPLNVFGTGVASPSAIAYVSPSGNFENINLHEAVLSFAAQGSGPGLFKAGPVALAAGAEYRSESGRIDADPRGQTSQWFVADFSGFAGRYNVEEAFLEANLPLLKDTIVEKTNLQVAGRVTNYSTSGLVEAWKIGTVVQLNDQIQVRSAASVDIRAPNLAELFQSNQINTGTAIDPHTGKAVSIFVNRRGNSALQPEIAHTYSGGVVLTPGFGNLRLSLDWHMIDISHVIFTPTTSQVLSLCKLGNAFFCSEIHYNGTAYPGALGQVDLMYVNGNSLSESGFDFSVDGETPIFDGSLSVHMIGTYTDEETRRLGGVSSDFAGGLGPDSIAAGFPKFRTTLSFSYRQGLWNGTMQARFIGSARLNNAWIAGVDVDDNSVPFVTYFDLRGSYRWTDQLELYFAIDNIADIPPPIIAPSYATSNSFQNEDTRGDIYDELGRSLRLGIRFAT